MPDETSTTLSYHPPCRNEALYAAALAHFRRLGPHARGAHFFAARARKRVADEMELERATTEAAT